MIEDTKVNELQIIESILENNRAKFNIDIKKIHVWDRECYKLGKTCSNE